MGKRVSRATGETVAEDKSQTQTGSEIPEPDPDRAENQDTSTADETANSQAGRDSSRWIPRERFTEVSRERARLKEQTQELREELRRLKVENALNRIGFQLIKPDYAQFFKVDTERLFDPDGEVDLEYLKSAAATFQAEHPELIRPWRTRKRENRSYLSAAYQEK